MPLSTLSINLSPVPIYFYFLFVFIYSYLFFTRPARSFAYACPGDLPGCRALARLGQQPQTGTAVPRWQPISMRAGSTPVQTQGGITSDIHASSRVGEKRQGPGLQNSSPEWFTRARNPSIPMGGIRKINSSFSSDFRQSMIGLLLVFSFSSSFSFHYLIPTGGLSKLIFLQQAAHNHSL